MMECLKIGAIVIVGVYLENIYEMKLTYENHVANTYSTIRTTHK